MFETQVPHGSVYVVSGAPGILDVPGGFFCGFLKSSGVDSEIIGYQGKRYVFKVGETISFPFNGHTYPSLKVEIPAGGKVEGLLFF